MVSELARSSHSVGESNLHLQITPAYRRDIFVEPLARELMVGYLAQKANQLNIHLAAVECGPDHVHLFLTNWKNYAPAELARQLKGYSSYMMRRAHRYLLEKKLWGPKLWTHGYFYRTVGAVNAETVKKYIEEGQDKHWTDLDKNQQTLFNFSR